MSNKVWLWLSFFLLISLNHAVLAQSGNLFSLTASGTPATLNVRLCLYGYGPTSCENHSASGRTLTIQSNVPNGFYPATGIKLLNSNLPLTGCTLIANGYCIFTLMSSTPSTIEVGSTTIPVSLTSISPTSGPEVGGTGFTITGTNLTGTTSVTFGGIAATSINVVNATTVTGVTPAHTIGVVDVTLTTSNGFATLPNGFTYLTTTVGQQSGGGIIACLNGGDQDFIAASQDNRGSVPSVPWGGAGIATGATSFTDGETNTAIIVAALGAGTYAAQVCNDYEVDSQGNTPCQAGNTCYGDWFLGALSQVGCMALNRVAIGGFSPTTYWSSTENDATDAWRQDYGSGVASPGAKILLTNLVRCIRPL